MGSKVGLVSLTTPSRVPTARHEPDIADAHSFFLAALDQIHAHAKGQLSSCNCIAHQTFSGSLLSSVTCSTCKSTSSTIDPILDIQLDFPYHLIAGTGNGNSISNGSKGDSGDALTNGSDGQNGSGRDEPLTLAELLRQFTAAEKLGKSYACAKCGPGQNAKRRLCVKRLPQVLSFQLKVSLRCVRPGLVYTKV
jgi:ubiquitin carboxyl-terminal hydrolase 22/27/51